MARQKPQDVADELEELDDQVYGESTVSGSAPDTESDDNVLDNVEAVIGQKPDERPWGFNIGDEINEDEESIAHGKPEENIQDEVDDAEEDELDDLGVDEDLLRIDELEEVDEGTSEDDEEN